MIISQVLGRVEGPCIMIAHHNVPGLFSASFLEIKIHDKILHRKQSCQTWIKSASHMDLVNYPEAPLADNGHMRHASSNTSGFLTLAPVEDNQSNAFGSVCLYVCARNSKTIAPIDFICLQK